MQTSRAIKKRRDDNLLTGWEPAPDHAPSIMREEQPTVARIVALAGLFLILIGLIPILGPRLFRMQQPVIPEWLGVVLVTIGILADFYHAFVDRDRVFRRMYAGIGLVLIAVAVALRFWPTSIGFGGYFPMAGVPALMLGLVLLVASVRGETERNWRVYIVNLTGVLGLLMILAAVGIGLFTRMPYLSGEGALLAVVGLLYVGTFINFQETDDSAYYTGLGLGAIGLIAVVGGIIRSAWPESLFLVPDGLILIGAGIVYLAVCAGICLDWPIVVLTRRELASLFYSPVAYLVLIGMVVVGWWMFARFLFLLAVRSLGDPRIPPIFEPIVLYYVVALVPVIVQIFVVPAITMRLLAEEKRTGTLEVLLTAPVNEPTIVLSKFFAAWVFNLLTWVPWWLNLVALRYMADTEFDYRPILCFNVTLLPVTAGFIAMGLFFSSLTRNQIIAAVLTFVGMMAHLAAYLLKDEMRIEESSVWYEILTYVSFLDLWLNSLQGVFAPRFLIFHLSLAIFFLYASIKVLEARKWT